MAANGRSPRVRPGRWLPIAAIALGGAALRFWRVGHLPLVGDEAYYWLWSRHLDWCYYDNPGATAWMIRLSTLIGGESELGVRWLNSLLGVADIVMMYGIGRMLFSSRAGEISAAFLAAGAPHIITSRFVYTDGITSVLFLLNLLLVLPVLVSRDGPVPWWRWPAITVSWLALLQTKLSIYPYLTALACGMLLWRRDLLQRRSVGLAAAGASLGLSPLLLWNARHGWVGLRWIVRQSTQGAILASSEWASIYHAIAYLTTPILLACLLGLVMWRQRGGRWLALIALWLLLPVLASPADSPRNLLQGTLPLLSLSGGFFAERVGALRWQRLALALLLGATLVYGMGTVLSIADGRQWPSNGMAEAIRRDGMGRRSLAARLRSEESPIVTVDYSLAAQLAYYGGRPVYSTWGQYRIWGIPDLDHATFVSLGYVPAALIQERLREAFADVQGPQVQEIGEYGDSTRVSMWRGRGLIIGQEELLRSLDFLTLYEASRKAEGP